MNSVKFMPFREMIGVYRKSDIERVKYTSSGKLGFLGVTESDANNRHSFVKY